MASPPGAYVSPQPFIESGTATVPSLFEWHTRENPSRDVFRFYTAQGLESLNVENKAELSKFCLPSNRRDIVLAMTNEAVEATRDHLTQ